MGASASSERRGGTGETATTCASSSSARPWLGSRRGAGAERRTVCVFSDGARCVASRGESVDDDDDDDDDAPARCERVVGKLSAVDAEDRETNRVRWRVRVRDGSEDALASADFGAAATARRDSRCDWRFVLRTREDDEEGSVSVYVQRRDGARGTASKTTTTAVEMCFELAFVGRDDGSLHFQTYLSRVFDGEGDSWGIKHAFKVHEAPCLVSAHGDVEVEVCIHDIRACRARRSKESPPVASSIRCLSEDCLLFVLEDFFSDDEAQELMDIATPSLQRSRVTDGKFSEGRTSSSCFLTGARGHSDVVRAIESRIQKVVHLPIVTSRRDHGLHQIEPMQIVKYAPGERYTAHYDNRAGSLKRTLTFMGYLHEPESGGATHFPKAIPLCGNTAHPGGIRIYPKRGRAILFWSVKSDGQTEAMRSLHEAESVESGYKWIFTQWLSSDGQDDDE